MTVAFDTHSITEAQDPSISHAAAASGVVCAIGIGVLGSTTANVNTMTYAAVELTDVTGSQLVSVGESFNIKMGFDGDSVAQGTQTFAAEHDGNPSKEWVCITLTGSADVVEQDAVTINSASLENPSDTLLLGGNDSFCVIAFGSGQGNVNNITPFSGWGADVLNEDDFGQRTCGIYSYDTVGTSDVTAGWTQTADDAVMIGAAFTESANGGPAAAVFGHNQFHNTLN